MPNFKLSIIILSFNTEKLLKNCLDSLNLVRNEVDLEVLVSDNGSHDGSLDMVKKYFPWVTRVDNKKNLGFARGNNTAKNKVSGDFVLFLNSDTIVNKTTLLKTVRFLDQHKNVGALTCKTVLPNGNLDKDARRRFPTPWISFKRLILGNGKDYWYEDISPDITHEVDVIQGAFFLTRKKILDSVGWFSEEYFLDGEDIDLCWKIKEAGWQIIYFPEVSIIHVKGASKGKHKHSYGKVTHTERVKFVNAGLVSMEIFYRKFFWNRYPLILNWFVVLGINFLRALRYLKAFIS